MNLRFSLFAIGFFLPLCASAQGIFSVSVTPDTVLQGEPAFIHVQGVTKAEIQRIVFDGKILPIFIYHAEPSVLLGIDIRHATGTFPIFVRLTDGRESSTTLAVQERQMYRAPLGIPEKLGGNAPANQAKVVDTLSIENMILASLTTGAKAFWTKSFSYPLSYATVTDPYGYDRQTGAYTIVHKGTDFQAAIGTPVYAANRGVARLVKNFTVYGKTVVVDHGLGLETFYMHLSKIFVNQGQLVLPGQRIGLSGETGYANAPHLHVSVRIGGISIDPVKFFDLFK